MKKILLCLVLASLFITLVNIIFAEEGNPCNPCSGKFKIEGYAEYINFNNDIDMNTWGGGILARYMLLDWLGGQTNFTLYSDNSASNFDGDLSIKNWRASVILHTYLPEILDKLYIYGGGGAGLQFNDDVNDIEIDDGVTLHVLAGIGYDITERLSLEAELGYQFGHADVKNYSEDDVSIEALFIRLAAGLKF